MNPLLVVLFSYCIGSLPTALIVSRFVARVDIRDIGDGNMGARNVTRTLGWGPGIFVAAVDFSKGGMAILIAEYFGLSIAWQLISGCSAVIGHDFPIWARFKGGQGMASILGMLFILLPMQTMWGLVIFLLAYLVTRNFDLSAGIGLGLLAFLVWYYDEQLLLLYFTIFLFVSILCKKIIDLPRSKRIKYNSLEKSQSEIIDACAPEESSNGVYLHN